MSCRSGSRTGGGSGARGHCGWGTPGGKCLTLYRRRYSPPESQLSTRICGQLDHGRRPAARCRCCWLGEGDAHPAGGARTSNRQATPRLAVIAATTSFSSRAPRLRDWRRTCADHHLHRASNGGHGSPRASQHAGCLGAKCELLPPPQECLSGLLRVCVCRDGTLLPVLYVCVSPPGSESWYLGRPS